MEIEKYTNIEAEQIILGSIIINNSYALRVADILDEKHFYFIQNKTIWKRFIEVAKEGVANEITLQSFFVNNEIIANSGGITYFNALFAKATGVIDIRDYAYHIIELWQKRELHVLLTNSLEALNDKEFDSIAANLENELAGLAIQEPKKKTQHVKELLEELETDLATGLSEKFTPTGFSKLDNILNGGIHNQQLVIIGARPSVGKAQPLDSKVLTVDGWKIMKDIKIGDKLASIDGAESSVIGVYPQGIKEIISFTFKDGRKVECCFEHLWRVYYRHWKKPRIINAARLIEMLNCKRYKNRLWIDEFEGSFGSDKALPIDPWVLGVLIGDGGLSHESITFTNSSEEIILKLKEKIGDNFIIKLNGNESKIDYSIIERKPQFLHKKKINRLKESLKHLRLHGCRSYEKFIPNIYLESNKNNRLELLRGLLDTDGYVGKRGSITYYTSSEQLSKDVIYLAQSLGATTYVSNKIPSYVYKGEKKTGRLHYVIQISYSKGSEFLTLLKKKERVKVEKTKHKRNTFFSYEIAGSKEAQCIKVSHKDELYITDNFIPTHNTSIAQNIILNASKRGKKCLFISLEVDKRNVILKFLSNLSSVEAWKIGRNILRQDELQDVQRAKKELAVMEIFTNDSSYLRISQIAGIIKNQIEKQPVDLVIVDYVQIIKGDDTKWKNEASVIKENTTMLKALAKQYDVGILALAQINRKAVEGSNQEPTINDFKSSGGIEEDADVAIILHRDRCEEKKEGYFSESGKLIVAKNRHGRTGEIGIEFNGKHGRFIEIGI